MDNVVVFVDVTNTENKRWGFGSVSSWTLSPLTQCATNLLTTDGFALWFQHLLYIFTKIKHQHTSLKTVWGKTDQSSLHSKVFIWMWSNLVMKIKNNINNPQTCTHRGEQKYRKKTSTIFNWFNLINRLPYIVRTLFVTFWIKYLHEGADLVSQPTLRPRLSSSLLRAPSTPVLV